MKTFITTILILIAITTLTACTGTKALTEEEQATKFGMTLQEYRESKQAAARMNMNMDEHTTMDE